MLQQCEYSFGAFAKWGHRASNLRFRAIAKRQKLKWTMKVKILFGLMIFSAVLILPLTLVFWPVAWPMILGFWNAVFMVLQKPIEIFIVLRATRKLQDFKGIKIAVLGSYGKTTAKEVLATVFGSFDGVAIATLGNKNTLLGNAKFIEKVVSSSARIAIFELGEFKFGDIRKMAKMIRPDYAIMTGVSGAHLDTLGDLSGVVRTLDEVREFVPSSKIAVNADNEILRDVSAEWRFSVSGVSSDLDDFGISDVEVLVDGTRFKFMGLAVFSPLLGEHNVAIVAMAIYWASSILDLGDAEILENLARLRVFEHRMEPRKLTNGALVIDDTYNGNLEGVRAGLRLLGELDLAADGTRFVRKSYATPGLVEQGALSDEIHEEMGELIAAADVDNVYLMRNSTTSAISRGLQKGEFAGRLTILENPLDFYENLDKVTVAGDVILMQNDWTDNYE
jgi:UDP-N-acetylmuramoyl-tripeptide--D-alanyl-D-alanine ligase